MPDQPHPDLLRHTADVVSAHLSHNQVESAALPQLITSVYQALAGLGTEAEVVAVRPDPAVPIRRSVFPDYIVCLEDGAKLKMLKRYIEKRFGLTPAAYRERWGLPSDYPMVAPNYAQRRSVLAREIGLGRKAPAEQPADEPVIEPPVEPPAEPAIEAEQGGGAVEPPKAPRRRKAPAPRSGE